MQSIKPQAACSAPICVVICSGEKRTKEFRPAGSFSTSVDSSKPGKTDHDLFKGSGAGIMGPGPFLTPDALLKTHHIAEMS